MSKEKFRPFCAVHLILMRNENEVLLLRRFGTGYRDGSYSVPAGHIEGEESAMSAMCREAHEEVGIGLAPEDFRFSYTQHTLDGRETISFFFVAKKWDGEIVNKEPNKCDDLSWFPIDDLPENTIPYIRQAIENVKNGVTYSEFGWGE